MESVIADAFAEYARERIRSDFTTECGRQAWPGVINQDDEDVGGVIRQVLFWHPLGVGGLLHGPTGLTGRPGWWERKHILRHRSASQTGTGTFGVVVDSWRTHLGKSRATISRPTMELLNLSLSVLSPGLSSVPVVHTAVG